MRPRTLELWRDGFGRLAGFGRILPLVWGVQLALALPAVAPVHQALDDALSNSRYRTVAARGFDLDWFMDFQSNRGDALAATQPALLLAAALTLVVTVFFAGGLLGRLRTVAVPAPEPGMLALRPAVRVADFLAEAARYFPRFLRLFLLTALGYALVFWLIRVQLSDRLEDAMAWWPSRTAVLWVRVVFSAVVLWLFAWLHTAQDLARIAVVSEERRSMVAELGRGIVSAARNLETLPALYLLGLAAVLVVALAQAALGAAAGRLPASWSWLAVLAVTQAALLARLWIGFGLTASLLGWYESSRSAVLPSRREQTR